MANLDDDRTDPLGRPQSAGRRGYPDVRVPLVPTQLEVSASDEVAMTLGLIGRSEDVAVAPAGHRLVVTGFNANVLALVDFTVEHHGRSRRVDLRSVELVRTEKLARPHGVAFLDDHTMLVANRESELLLVDLTPSTNALTPSTFNVRVLVDGSSLVPVHTPGSVAVRWPTSDVVDVIVCNNYVHDITRYVLDATDNWRVLDSERLLARGLEIPDGVAVSHSGEWIAISNHDTHRVHLYRYDDALGVESEPDGILIGPNYPHGLRFSADDRHVLLADAGLPYVYTFATGDGDWSGSHSPSAVTRVMDDESFNRGRYNPQEGGPKGIDVTVDGLVIVTSEFQPLGFFELEPSTVTSLPVSRSQPELRVVSEDAPPLVITRLRHRLDEALQQLEQERTATAEVASAFAAERDRLVDQVAASERTHEAAIAEAIDEKQRLAVEHQRLADALHTSEAERVRVALEASDASQRVRQLDDALELVHVSSSWRITAPLRALSDVVRALSGRLRR